MVVKMMKWSPWPAAATKRYQVKVKLMRLEGSIIDGLVMVELKWKGPKSGLGYLRRRSKKQCRNVSEERRVGGDFWAVDLGDEFENVCGFSILQKDDKFNAWESCFSVLYGGQSEEARTKVSMIGRSSLNIAELALQMQNEESGLQLERKLPISLQIDGVATDATLSIAISFVEIRTSQESPETVQTANTAEKEDSFLKRWVDVTNYVSQSGRVKKGPEEAEEVSDLRVSVSDDSIMFDDESDQNLCPSSVTQSESSPKKKSFLSWKKRRLNFRSPSPPLPKKLDGEDGSSSDESTFSMKMTDENSAGPPLSNNDFTVGSWEEKELISRDGKAKLKASVFFASIDQRSESAAGESACSALVAVIADWLHAYRNSMPTRSEFDNLIREGSLEWQKLCKNPTYREHFPDKHFDLDTVLGASVWSLSVMPERSFVGFFSPESFESLHGLMSFDEIWEEISGEIGEECRVYIVSWNDHFFVLMVEAGVYYIIDTLGERLFEGCNQAYILRFDETATLCTLPQKQADRGSMCTPCQVNNDGKEMLTVIKEATGGDDSGLVYNGKECCREFINRFLAAIPLRELEMEAAEKGTVSTITLLQRLQIELHFSISSSSSSASSSSSSSSSSLASSLLSLSSSVMGMESPMDIVW